MISEVESNLRGITGIVTVTNGSNRIVPDKSNIPKFRRTEPVKSTLNEESGPLLGAPTDAMPGSDRKVDVLAERYENGESLFHPEDEDGQDPVW